MNGLGFLNRSSSLPGTTRQSTAVELDWVIRVYRLNGTRPCDEPAQHLRRKNWLIPHLVTTLIFANLFFSVYSEVQSLVNSFAVMRPGIFAIFYVTYLSVFSGTDAGSDCPYGWVKHQKSCYFAATAWTRLTYYDAMAFCKNFGAKLVEFNSVAEYNYITSTAYNYPWWNGPWIGLIKPFDGADKSWVLPSTRSVSKDSDLNRIIDAAALRDSHRCGGLNRRGGGFGFWDCGGQDTFSSEPQKGSPWCELNLDD